MSIPTSTDNDFSSPSGLDMKAKEAGTKFSSNDWKAAEKKLTAFDQNVKDELCAMANSLAGIKLNGKADDLAFKTVGDDFYKLIREELLKAKLVNEQVQEHAKKTKEKPMKAADKIRQENTLRIINEELKKTLSGFDYKDYRLPAALNNKILEMRGIGFFQAARFLIQNFRLYVNADGIIKKKKIHFVYNIIIAMQKFYAAVMNMEGNSLLNASQTQKISDNFTQDFKKILDKLKEIYDFNGMIAYENDPQLLFYTDYDSYIPNKGFKPYVHQIEVTKHIMDSIVKKKPMVISYKAMTGNGKTVSVVAIAKMIMNLKTMYKEHESLELLFCCNLRSVKEQASQWLFNSDIPFALGVIDGDRGLRVINNFNCKSDDKRVAIVCSPEACYELITNNPDNKKRVLFLDEPNIGADVKSSASKMNVRLMSVLPFTSVLSSATLPHDTYQWIKDNHAVKFGESEFPTVYSNKIHIGCEIKTFDGELVVPHLNSKTSAELTLAIERISEIPFLGRAYTTNVVKSIYQLMKDKNIEGIPDIPTLFKDIDNLNTDSVRNLAMDLLKVLATQSDEIITDVCSTKIEKIAVQTLDAEEEVEADEDSDIEWEEEPKIVIENKVNFDKLGTSDSHKFMRQNLIVTLNPTEFAIKNFKSLIDEVNKEIGSLKKLSLVVEQQMVIWQKTVDRLENHKFENEMQRLKETEEIMNSKPTFKMPSQFQVNTVSHIRHFAKTTTLAIDRNAIRNELIESDIPMDSMVITDELMILLWCGIGVYTPSQNLNHT